MEIGDNVNMYVRKGLFNKLKPAIILKSCFEDDNNENIKYVNDNYSDFINTLFVASPKYDKMFENGSSVEDIDNNVNYNKSCKRIANNTLIIVDSFKDRDQKYIHLENAFDINDMESIRIDYISDVKFKNKYALHSINAKTFLGFLNQYLSKDGLSSNSSSKVIDILQHLNFTILIY